MSIHHSIHVTDACMAGENEDGGDILPPLEELGAGLPAVTRRHSRAGWVFNSRVASRPWTLLLLWLAATGAASTGERAAPLDVSQPGAAGAEAMLAVEIPAGSFTKYEIGEDGHVYVDRFLSTPVVYPANYGSMPGTRAGDGDPLDALVLARAPLHPGVLVRFRPIGVLRMLDGDEDDAKIIGVPADDVDPHYAGVRDIADLPRPERQRIEAFFRVYKDLPDGAGANPVRLQGFGNAAEARDLIRGSLSPQGGS